MDHTQKSKRIIKTPLASIVAGATPQPLDGLTHDELNKRLMLAKVRIKIAIESEASVPDAVRLELWLISCEMTRRGIPPSLRDLPEPSDDDPEQIADRCAIDLQWLVARYPEHKTNARRWQHLWRTKNFHYQADFISVQYPQREGWWFVKGLALSDEQDREMHFLRRYRTARLFEHTEREKDVVRVQLSTACHKIGKHPRHRSSDPIKTIQRRLDIWRLGTLFGWKSPTKIASLYRAITGEDMTRSLADKIVQQIAKALPATSNQIDKQRGKRV